MLDSQQRDRWVVRSALVRGWAAGLVRGWAAALVSGWAAAPGSGRAAAFGQRLGCGATDEGAGVVGSTGPPITLRCISMLDSPVPPSLMSS
jgi:hypothetical protein